MRRRRGDNKLLVRMIVIGVIVTIAVLPILAYLGAFKGGKGSSLMQMTMMPPPPKVPKQERQAKKPQHVKPHVASHKAGKTPQSTKALNVHVAAAMSKGPPSDNSIVNGTSTKVGVVPPSKPTEPVGNPPTPIVKQTAPVIAPTPPVKPTPPPAPIAEAPKPPAPPPHVPVVAAAVPLAQPQPQVPDDLELDSASTFEVLFTIHADGTADVKMEHSTGNDELDKLSLDAARKWRFKPATKDGVPTESYLHVDFDFQVS